MATTTTKKTNKKLGWHFLPADMKLDYGDDRKAEVGKTLSIPKDETPITCSSGMHASETVKDACHYRKGPVLCRVEVSGDLNFSSDKFCGRHRKVLWARKISESDISSFEKKLTGSTSYGSVADRLQAIRHSEGFERTIRQWAKKNGCANVSLPRKPRPKKVLPRVTAKFVRGILSPRDVVTRTELETECRRAKLNIDTLNDALWSIGSLATIHGWNRHGTAAYVLRNTK